MYIKNLSDKEIKQVFKILLSVVEKDNDNVKMYVDNCKIERTDAAVNIKFYVGYEETENWCFISDYNAIISFGSVTDDKNITIAYRKYMYKKFGDKYYTDIKDYYKTKIKEKYDKELEAVNNELNEAFR